jgi:hypothetical protein
MKPAVRRRLGLVAGLVIGGAALAWLVMPAHAHLHAPGPMNTGHADLACTACHREAPGSVRQQLQAVVQHALGLVPAGADVGFAPVSNAACLSCHDRPDDRHPVSRFLEPRFARARAALHPERCTSCHLEHHGVRVTVGDPTYCRNCHADTRLEHDPLDVSHQKLVSAGRWETCLGCHDFHGNHRHVAPRRLDQALSPAQIRAYLDGGPSPYGPPIRRARKGREI